MQGDFTAEARQRGGREPNALRSGHRAPRRRSSCKRARDLEEIQVGHPVSGQPPSALSSPSNAPRGGHAAPSGARVPHMRAAIHERFHRDPRRSAGAGRRTRVSRPPGRDRETYRQRLDDDACSGGVAATPRPRLVRGGGASPPRRASAAQLRRGSGAEPRPSSRQDSPRVESQTAPRSSNASSSTSSARPAARAEIVSRGPALLDASRRRRQRSDTAKVIRNGPRLAELDRPQAQLPPSERRPPPKAPEALGRAKGMNANDYNNQAYEALEQNMAECTNCGRTFAPDRLKIHQRSCTAASPARRPPSRTRSGVDASAAESPARASQACCRGPGPSVWLHVIVEIASSRASDFAAHGPSGSDVCVSTR